MFNKDKALEKLAALENEAKDLRKLIENDKPKNIMEAVTSFEDAQRISGLNVSTYLTKDEEAYQKLKIIVKVLNEGWEPDWDDSNQRKYFPVFNLRNGFSFDAVYDGWLTGSAVGSRLVFKNEKLAEYAAKQFLSLYKDYLK